MAKIAVEGFAALEKRMREVPTKLQTKAVSKGLAAAARVVVRAAKASAPIGATGALRRNIAARRGKERGKPDLKLIRIGVLHGKVPVSIVQTAKGARVQIRTRRGLKMRKLTAREKRHEDPYYFRWQELGFHAVGRKRKGSGRLIEGRRFLTKAFDTHTSQILAALRNAITAELPHL